MSGFKAYDGGEPFLKPERPFLLLAEDNEHSISYHWMESEEELQEVVLELKDGGCRILDAIEIGSLRDVEIKPEYQVDDFYRGNKFCI